jgi:hypothetical protein
MLCSPLWLFTGKKQSVCCCQVFQSTLPTCIRVCAYFFYFFSSFPPPPHTSTYPSYAGAAALPEAAKSCEGAEERVAIVPRTAKFVTADASGGEGGRVVRLGEGARAAGRVVGAEVTAGGEEEEEEQAAAAEEEQEQEQEQEEEVVEHTL